MYQYPPQAAFKRVLPKNKIYQYAKPSRPVQRCFVEEVNQVVWQYKLSPETIHLPARPGVPEIQIFTISLRTDEISNVVLRTIDGAIPFPIFYEVSRGNRTKSTAAYKRPSDADSSKWVVGDYFDTEWQPADAPRARLPVSLDLAGLYEQMLRRLMPLPARNGESLKSHAERLSAIRSKENQCQKLEARLEREKQFNRKVELNAELRTIKNELESLIG